MAKKSAKSKGAGCANGTNAVDVFMASLDHPLRPEIEAIRALILASDRRICEAVKWNAPSFYITEHFATFKLRPVHTIQVVFHTGAKVKERAAAIEIDDSSSMLKWPAIDRSVATLSDMNDIKAKRAWLTSIVKQWLKQMP